MKASDLYDAAVRAAKELSGTDGAVKPRAAALEKFLTVCSFAPFLEALEEGEAGFAFDRASGSAIASFTAEDISFSDEEDMTRFADMARHCDAVRFSQSHDGMVIMEFVVNGIWPQG